MSSKRRQREQPSAATPEQIAARVHAARQLRELGLRPHLGAEVCSMLAART
jgi:hypothetical protein